MSRVQSSPREDYTKTLSYRALSVTWPALMHGFNWIGLALALILLFWNTNVETVSKSVAKATTKDLKNSTMVVHVRYKSLYISLPSSAQVKFYVF